jgi:hypothetical protein
MSQLEWARQSESLARMSDQAFAERLASTANASGRTEVQNLLEEAARRIVTLSIGRDDRK